MRISEYGRVGGCRRDRSSPLPTLASRARRTCRLRSRGPSSIRLLRHRTTIYDETRWRVACFSNAEEFLQTSPAAQYLFSKTPEAATPQQPAVFPAATPIRDNESQVLQRPAAFCCA